MLRTAGLFRTAGLLRTVVLALALSALSTAGLRAQEVAVKTNVLADALTSPNIGVEVKLSERFSVGADFHYNPIPWGEGIRWKHWMLRPELRYWTCQPFGGHFFGVHLMYGVYNIGNIKLPLGIFKSARSSRYEGEFMGAGLSYGYHFILSPRWSIETSIGVGFLHNRHERYRCFHCGEKTGSGSRNFIAPTRAAVSLVYVIK